MRGLFDLPARFVEIFLRMELFALAITPVECLRVDPESGGLSALIVLTLGSGGVRLTSAVVFTIRFSVITADKSGIGSKEVGSYRK